MFVAGMQFVNNRDFTPSFARIHDLYLVFEFDEMESVRNDERHSIWTTIEESFAGTLVQNHDGRV